TYYVQTAASGAAQNPTGAYRLQLTLLPDDFGNTFETAHPFTLSPSASGSQGGSIDYPQDLDFFQLVAPRAGLWEVTLNSAPASNLDGALTVYDGMRQQIGYEPNRGGLPPHRVILTLAAGQTYYVQVSNSTGIQTG